jgi:curved DNA-binding protein CbpA
MDFKDYYKILGVEPTADDKAIKAAYRKLGAQIPPRRQQGKRRRGQVQGRVRGLRGA